MPQARPTRILIADNSRGSAQLIRNILESQNAEVREASSEKDCQKEAEQFQPDAIFLCLITPSIHGMKCLKTLKGISSTEKIPVVIMTEKALLQNYETSIDAGASYFLTKPYLPHELLSVFKKIQEKKLSPAPFKLPSHHEETSQSPYSPHSELTSNYIHFWGTRGSIPVAAPGYRQFGGNTSCLEISHGNNLVVIDAGTGIRALGDKLLKNGINELDLFIGHTHWDHILGFPFFAPVYSPSTKMNIYAPTGFGKTIKELFTGMLNQDYFPISLDKMQAQLKFKPPEQHQHFGKIKIETFYATHPGAVLCFKITTPRRTIGYATDNEFLLGFHGHPNELHTEHPALKANQGIIDFFKGVDILVHEAQYFNEDYLARVGWGHSSMSNAAVLIKEAGIKQWIVTHHDPSHTDEVLHEKLYLQERILHECNIDCNVQMAYDDLGIPI